ncbi:MGDG synthase family glycosyltransferase [Christensenella tenuis]|uniref:Galactosyldiacylglycerol synthase n=1 Tax=Christensenella tenuis TaxID=2763033 RepID=A0ABR7EI65_9FIRM|nr:glycosyltransferase [Christensenella tenuis]MBC5649467.1 galactosyldiacylglycerol synthase [Christensenella tenuis]
MKVLVLSMTVGQGHNSTSKALRAALLKRGHQCDILDTYKFLNKAIGLGFDKGYAAMGRFIPKLNETIYKGAEKANGRADMKLYFPWAFANLAKSKLQKYIDEEKPDVIVCSIVMTAMLITALKEAGTYDDRIKSIGIVTDYSLHPFWEYTAMDYFVAPNELLIPEFTQRGIPENKILPTGIPVDPKFARAISRNEAREKLGLDPEKFVILLTSGGMGFAGMTPVMQDVDQMDDVQLVAVCGSNKHLKSRLSAVEYKNDVRVLGFVDNMEAYMDAADIIITKPGGLSTSETIAKRKPLLLMKPMPGVENMNLAFLLNHSLAVHCSQYQSVSQVIMQLRLNNFKLREMERAQKKWGKKHSAKTLAEFIEKLV